MYLSIFRQTNVQKTEEITIVGCLGALILTVATNMISSPAVIPKPMFWDKRMAFAAEWGIKKYSGSKPIKTLVSKKHISYKNKFQWWVGYIFSSRIFFWSSNGGDRNGLARHSKASNKNHSRQNSAGLPACLIGRCCSCFCYRLVLVPLFSCCAFLLRLNQGHPPPPSTLVLLPLPLLLPPPQLLPLLLRLLRILYSFLPSSPITTLVVPVANDTGLQHCRRLQVLVTGRTRYWSTSTHLVCVPLVVQARICYSSCFWSRLCLSLFFSQAST